VKVKENKVDIKKLLNLKEEVFHEKNLRNFFIIKDWEQDLMKFAKKKVSLKFHKIF
jgi:hypothetical protein